MAVGGTKVNPKKFEPSQIPLYVYLLPLAVLMGAPIVYIVCHAFKPMDELFAFPPKFFVTNPSGINFVNLFQQAAGSTVPFSRYVFNSLVVTVAVVVLSIMISTMAAFALSKMRFKAKGIMMEINAMPVCLFLIKQFMDQVPDSLLEAAQLEGASSFTIYLKIILPMVKPAIATGAILSFQQVWNNTETSNLFTSTESIRTLAFYMNTLSGVGTVQGQGMAAAAALIMFVPNLLLFIVSQSSVMNTMAHSGLK